MEEQKKIIEINGIKMEVDLRYAKKVESFRVGDSVKLLKKQYGDSFKSYAGVIVGFDAFEKLPTIIIAYVDYNGIEMEYVNKGSKDVEMIGVDPEELPVSKADVLEKMDRELNEKEQEIQELKNQKMYFERHFQKYFSAFEENLSQA